MGGYLSVSVIVAPSAARCTGLAAFLRASTTSTRLIEPGARCTASTSIAKAERAVAGKVPVKRNRFIKLVGADKSVNRVLEAKARALAGLKGYITNLPEPSAEFVIGAYHRLFEIERSFRMSKHDLAARPIYHHKRLCCVGAEGPDVPCPRGGGSDGESEFGERGGEPILGISVDAEFVVAAAEVLDEGVPGADDPCRA